MHVLASMAHAWHACMACIMLATKGEGSRLDPSCCPLITHCLRFAQATAERLCSCPAVCFPQQGPGLAVLPHQAPHGPPAALDAMAPDAATALAVGCACMSAECNDAYPRAALPHLKPLNDMM